MSPTPTRSERRSHFRTRSSNTQLFLDYPNAGREFTYKILPITVNCYGQHAIARHGGLARFADIARRTARPVRAHARPLLRTGTRGRQAFRNTDIAGRAGRLIQLVTRVPERQDWHHHPRHGGGPRLYERSSRRLRDLAGHPGREIVDSRASTKCSTGSAWPERSTNSAWSCLVRARHHRCLQLQQVFCGVRRKGRAMTRPSQHRVKPRGDHRRRGYQQTTTTRPAPANRCCMLHGSGPGVSAMANWQHNIRR